MTASNSPLSAFDDAHLDRLYADLSRPTLGDPTFIMSLAQIARALIDFERRYRIGQAATQAPPIEQSAPDEKEKSAPKRAHA